MAKKATGWRGVLAGIFLFLGSVGALNTFQKLEARRFANRAEFAGALTAVATMFVLAALCYFWERRNRRRVLPEDEKTNSA